MTASETNGRARRRQCGGHCSTPVRCEIGAEQEQEYKRPILETYQTQGHPYYASARLWYDGVIEPAQTRAVLARCLEISHNAPIADTRFGVFRM